MRPDDVALDHEASQSVAGRANESPLTAVINAVLSTCSFGLEPRLRAASPANFSTRLSATKRRQRAGSWISAAAYYRRACEAAGLGVPDVIVD